MALILLIETATEVCSVGLARDGEMLSCQESAEAYRHAAYITRLTQACLDEAGVAPAELDAVAVSRGPGSFTALRVGVSAGKGLCYALDKPLLSVDTLQALAVGAQAALQREATYCPMIDARRMEVYTACYDHALRQLSAPRALIVDADAFAGRREAGEHLVLTGNGAEKCRPLLEGPEVTVFPLAGSARYMARLAEAAWTNKMMENLAYFEPFYLKPPNITKPKKNL